MLWCTNSLSREALTQNFGIFMDKEIPDGVIITVASRRLGERPASDWRNVSVQIWRERK
jgi:hypothetical protein